MANVQISYISESSELNWDYNHYVVNATGGDVTVTMPQIPGDGVKFWVCKLNNVGNSVTIVPYSGDSINVGNIGLNNYQAVSLVSFNGVWYRFNV